MSFFDCLIALLVKCQNTNHAAYAETENLENHDF